MRSKYLLCAALAYYPLLLAAAAASNLAHRPGPEQPSVHWSLHIQVPDTNSAMCEVLGADMTPKPPTRSDRTFVAKHLQREATRLRETAQRHRQTAASDTRPGVPEYFGKLASKQEVHAGRFERVAGWVLGDE